MAWTDPTLGGALDRTTGQPFTITIWKAILSNLLRLGGTTGLVPNASIAAGIDAAKIGIGYPSSYIQGVNGLSGIALVDGTVQDQKIISIGGAKVGGGINGNNLAGGTVHDGAIADVGANKVGWGYRSDYITVDNGLHGYKLIDGSVPDQKIISLSGNKVGGGINGANINARSVAGDKLVTQVEGGEVSGWSVHQGAMLIMTGNFPRAFSGTPVITATIKSFYSNAYLNNFSVSASATTTSFTIGVNNTNSNSDGTVWVSWIAVGPS